jgi:hypothetical protein
MAELRSDPPQRPDNYYKTTDGKSLHLSYMNSVSMSHLTLTNYKRQAIILDQELEQLHIYKKRLDKSNELERLYREEVL